MATNDSPGVRLSPYRQFKAGDAVSFDLLGMNRPTKGHYGAFKQQGVVLSQSGRYVLVKWSDQDGDHNRHFDVDRLVSL